MNKTLVKLAHRLICLGLIFSLVLISSACKLEKTEAKSGVARFGSLGRSYALDMVETYPFRSSASKEEEQFADYLVNELTKLRVSVEKIPFQYRSEDGTEKKSFNVVARFKGRGFEPLELEADDPLKGSKEMTAPEQLEGRKIILGAHYDSAISKEEADASVIAPEGEAALDEFGNLLPAEARPLPLTEADGIDDNASAVACLLTVANLFVGEQPAYDVDIVFFGAGHDGFAGAKAYAASIPDEEKALIDAMINLDSIYAGDKVYAHAGVNSVQNAGYKSYALRRKLYECTDVYYDNYLLTRNGFALYTNQMGCDKELNGETVVYREWSTRESDHSPFDRLGLPIVFFESADYDVEDCQLEVKESNDPYFAPVEGMIRGSAYDSSKRLLQYFVPEGQAKDVGYFGSSENQEDKEDEEDEEDDAYLKRVDRLEIRINNLAFIITEVCHKGPAGTKAK